MTRITGLAGLLSLTACSASIRRPIQPTDAATELEQVTDTRTNELNPAISPDGGAVAYEVLSAPAAAPHVEVMCLRPRPGHRVGDVEYTSGDTIGLEPAWKADGSGIVFVTRDGHSQKLVELFGQGSAAAPFLADTGDVFFGGAWPSVSPGGVILAALPDVQAYETGWPATRVFDSALAISDLHGTTLLGRGTEPAWSPDGSRMAFVQLTDGRAHVFVSAPDGSSRVQITSGPADDEAPAWSPDGTRIAFCSGTIRHAPLRANLFVVNPDGSDLRQLTEGDRFACRPSWGNDGYLYFHANLTDRFHIWRMRPR